MNKIFKKLTRRTIASNFKQFLSVIVIVFLASMLMSGFVTNYFMLNNTITTYFSDTRLADAWLYVDKISSDDETYFASQSFEFDKRFYYESSAGIKDTSLSNNSKIYVYDGKISIPYKESGTWGCIIDKNVAKNNNIKIGFDEVEFDIEYTLPGLDKKVELHFSFLITGTMSLDECADIYSSWPIFITEETFLAGISSEFDRIINENYPSLPNSFKEQLKTEYVKIPYNQVLIKTKANENIDDVLSDVKNYYENSTDSNLLYSFTQDSIESVVMLNSEIRQSKKMIYVFPIIFLLVSILIILTTIDQLVLQEKQRIGTLKSIGVPDKKILNHYSKFGAILCFIGASLGIIFGVAIIPSVMFIKYKLVYSLPNDYISLVLPTFWLLLVVFGITFLGFVVSKIACYNILHKKPIECLKFDVGNSKSLKKSSRKLKKLPFPVKMAMRNVKLKPLRTVMATIGIAGCVALLLCGFGISDTLNYSINYDFGKNLKYDINTTYTKSDFEEKLSGLEGLTGFEKYEKMYILAKSDSLVKNINVYQITEESMLTNFRLNLNESILSESLADDFNIKEGDALSLTLGGKTVEIVITKIAQTSVVNGLYIANDYGFDEIYKTKGMWIECANVTNEKVDFVNSINGTNTAKSMKGMMENINSKLSSISVMTTTLKIFAIALAVVVLLNLILLILKERVREIATLKVLGKDTLIISLSIFFEILFMSLFGSVLGMCFGYPLLVLVLSINKVEVMNFLYHINFSSFIFSVLLVIVTIVCVMFISTFKVKKINMIESLKSVE